MTCPYCGADAQDVATQCSQCGRVVLDKAPEYLSATDCIAATLRRIANELWELRAISGNRL